MFGRVLRWTIVAVFFLIFIGSVVRSTGSGMGCPDWPRCFGSYVPPLDDSELPKDYISYYQEARLKKNVKLSNLFNFFGLQDVLNDKKEGHSTYDEIEYDSTKAWIEYINRLVGVVVGFLVLGCFLISLKYIKSNLKYFIWCSIALILLLVQAYLGSIVVSTNLLPGMISVHMFLAVLLQFILLYLYFDFTSKSVSSSQVVIFPKWVLLLSLVVIVLSFIQMYLGINVRESVDYLHHHLGVYDDIIVRIGSSFDWHRSFSLLIIVFNIWLSFSLVRYGLNNFYSKFILPIIILEIFAGVSLAYFDLTPFAQPFHLLLSTLLLGIQFLNFLSVKFASNSNYGTSRGDVIN